MGIMNMKLMFTNYAIIFITLRMTHSEIEATIHCILFRYPQFTLLKRIQQKMK